jgi:hypothetical protein
MPLPDAIDPTSPYLTKPDEFSKLLADQLTLARSRGADEKPAEAVRPASMERDERAVSAEIERRLAKLEAGPDPERMGEALAGLKGRTLDSGLRPLKFAG